MEGLPYKVQLHWLSLSVLEKKPEFRDWTEVYKTMDKEE